MKASRFLYAAAALVVVAGSLVATFGVDTKYSCYKGIETPTRPPASYVRDDMGVSVPVPSTEHAPTTNYQWPARIFLVVLALIVAALIAAVASRFAAKEGAEQANRKSPPMPSP